MAEFKHRTTEEAWAALSRFIHRTPPIMTIPVDNERDADCILSDVISERDAVVLQVSEARTLLQEALKWTGVDPTAEDASQIDALDWKILAFLGESEKRPNHQMNQR